MMEKIHRPPTTKKLYLITNDTDQEVIFKNVKSESDTVQIKGIAMAHTGGKDGDYCVIPSCSDAATFGNNHLIVESTAQEKKHGTIKIAFWCGDTDHKLYYSLDGTYSGKKPVRDSKQWEGVSLLVSPGGHASSADVAFFKF